MNSDGSCQTKLLDSNASGPTWSPDSKRIAFSADLSEEGSNSIYVMNADGSGNPRRLTSSLQTLSPAWSPDGKKIAFEGANQIYVTKACCKLGSTKALTDGPGWNREPVWSPDGTELAFTHVDLGKEYWGEVIRNTDVYKMDADGSRETRLTHRFSSKYPEHDAVWSPTGDQIAFIKGYYTGTDSVYSDAIYIMNSHDSDPTLVRKVPEGYEMDIAWQ